MPLFSIITVCLNDLQNLKETAASVSCQEFKDFEYIICDGDSNDGTKEYLPSIGADLFISEPDKGIFFAMNKCLETCHGKYIYFLNAGDTFYSIYTLSNVAAFIQNHDGIKFFYGDIFYPASIRPYSIQPEKLSPFTLFRGTVCHQSWFLDANTYNSLHGFDTKMKYKGDYDALLRIIYELHTPYIHMPICVAKYMGGGYSEKTYNESRKEFEYTRRKYIPFYKAFYFSIFLKLFTPVKNNKYYRLFLARYNYWKALRSWPSGEITQDLLSSDKHLD